MSNDEMRRAALAECDHPEEIENAGKVVAAALRLGRSCEVTLAPGNGTRYCYLFTPFEACSTYETPRNGLESSAVFPGGVWVAIIGGYPKDSAVYPLALMGRPRPPEPSYLLEKWFPGRDSENYDVFVFEALLEVVGRRTALAPA